MLKLFCCGGLTIYKSGYEVHGRGYQLRGHVVTLTVSGVRGGRCGVSQEVSSAVWRGLRAEVGGLWRVHDLQEWV